MKPFLVAERVASVVMRGGTVVFPTDTVYGLGCDPANEDAVARVYALKGRSSEKPLSLHIGSVEEFLEYAYGDVAAERLARALLPGPLTIVVRRPSFVAQWVAPGRATIGLRVPEHALCLAILDRCGPLAATSANASGSPAYVGTGDVSALPAANLRVDDGATPLRVESTVIDISGDEPRLVREGAIGIAMLENALGCAVRIAARGRG